MKLALQLSVIYLVFVSTVFTAHSKPLIDRILTGDTSLVSDLPIQSTTSFFSKKDNADLHWDSRFGMPGVDGEVHALAIDGDWLYAGGLFTYAGNIAVNRIARWNRITHIWQPLGEGWANGVNGIVLTIAVRGDSVYVGGQFKQAGDVAAENIAVWNKRTGRWGTLGEGGVGDRYAYVSSIVTDAGHVYAGGRFTAMSDLITNNVAVWNGEQWDRLDAGTNGYIFTMLLHEGVLYVAGDFTTAGVDSASRVAVWQGKQWKALGKGFNRSVRALAIHRGELYAGGSFSASGSDTIYCIARWEHGSNQWRRLSADTATGAVYTMSSSDMGLICGGDMGIGGYRAGHVPLEYLAEALWRLAVWNGNEWRPLYSEWERRSDPLGQYRYSTVGGTTQTGVYSVIRDENDLYVGGNYSLIGYEDHNFQYAPLSQYYNNIRNIGYYDIGRRRWISLGNCPNNIVRSLIMYHGQLHAGGDFTSISGEFLSKIARWDGELWKGLGLGIDDTLPGAYDLGVMAMEVIGDNLYVGGRFRRAGAAPAYCAASWNSTEWTPLSLVPIYSNVEVDSILPKQRIWNMVSYDTTLYAVGVHPFGNLLHLSKGWDYLQFSSEGYQETRVIVADEDGNLYIGGKFITVNGVVANNIIRWRPATNTWESLGSGVNDSVLTMIVHDNRLYVGGGFTEAGGVKANRIAVYDLETERWSALGEGFDYSDPQTLPFVKALAFGRDGRLYAGGWFDQAGEIAARNVAVWDGETWRPLGSGVDGVVNAIAINGDDVYVGGEFQHVGGVIPSWNFARWNENELSVEEQRGEATQQLTLSATPNPVSGEMRLQYMLPTSGTIRVAVYDQLGREVAVVLDDIMMSSGVHSTTFNISTLPSGIYYCQLQSNGRVTTTRLVVSH